MFAKIKDAKDKAVETVKTADYATIGKGVAVVVGLVGVGLLIYAGLKHDPVAAVTEVVEDLPTPDPEAVVETVIETAEAVLPTE